jgi:hypothetical protein
MDVTALIFYAIVCGLLSLAAPTMGKPLIRVAVGTFVGIAAAVALPVLRGVFGLP